MRRLKAQHQSLPGIGELIQRDTASELTLTVISHRSGRRDIAVGRRDEDRPTVTAGLTRAEAVAVARC